MLGSILLSSKPHLQNVHCDELLVLFKVSGTTPALHPHRRNSCGCHESWRSRDYGFRTSPLNALQQVIDWADVEMGKLKALNVVLGGR